MKIAYLECFAGIAGDMFLGALVDAGVDTRFLQDAADSLHLEVRLDFQKVNRSGIHSTKARVLMNGTDADGGLPEAPTAHSHAHSHSHSHGTHTTNGHAHGRSLAEIRELILQARITNGAKRVALTAFESLGAAEAKIHGVPVESIHFHEVGAVDAIADIVCGAAGADALGADEWHCTPVNTGSGFVDCAHGRFPVPAPATLELLKDVPVYAEGPAKEMTTPTGAALLLALGCRFDGAPSMRTHTIAYGAGTRNPERFPNVLRLCVGEGADSTAPFKALEDSPETDTVTVLECAIDDATPEILAHTAQQLLEHGALDVMQQAVLMKKGRHGTLLTVLCSAEKAATCEAMLFRETTTLGIRRRIEQRSILRRSSRSVETIYGPIRIKTGIRGSEVFNIAPEFEDCKEAAQRYSVPVKEVMQSAIAAASLPLHAEFTR